MGHDVGMQKCCDSAKQLLVMRVFYIATQPQATTCSCSIDQQITEFLDDFYAECWFQSKLNSQHKRALVIVSDRKGPEVWLEPSAGESAHSLVV